MPRKLTVATMLKATLVCRDAAAEAEAAEALGLPPPDLRLNPKATMWAGTEVRYPRANPAPPRRSAALPPCRPTVPPPHHRLATSPRHQSANPPTDQPTNPSTHQPTNPPTHQVRGDAVWLKSSGSGEQGEAARSALAMLEAADQEFSDNLEAALAKRKEDLKWQHGQVRRDAPPVELVRCDASGMLCSHSHLPASRSSPSHHRHPPVRTIHHPPSSKPQVIPSPPSTHSSTHAPPFALTSC